MAALPITAQDQIYAEAAALEIETIMNDGATVGIVEVIPPTDGFEPNNDVRAFFKTAAVAILRQTQTIGPNATISVVSGTPQTKGVSGAFANPLVVVVRDAYSNPVPNVLVTFTAPGSGATAALSSPALTDANGQTQVTATANGTAGTYVVAAFAAGVTTPVTFVLTNTVNSISLVSGTPQIIGMSVAFPSPLIVAITDPNNNPVAGVTVTFAAPGSGASSSLSSPSVTDSNGRTQVSATANGTAGTYFITASIAGVATPVTFTLTNLDTKIVYANANAVNFTPQSITGGNAYNIVNFNNVAKDTISAITTGVSWIFKVPASRAGLYQVSTMVALTSPVSGDITELSLWKVNAANVEALEVVLSGLRTTPISGPAGSFLPGSAFIELAAGEGLRIKVRTSNPLAQDLLPSAGTSWIRVFRESDIPT